ncbi:hypothetical protein OE88DRAFT_1678891 [Heliocybe sulcata]|uniref:Alpha/beta-hydrolase n=1 Tax=Heliocybe sulcata TaxID=5364 RepID=A0A5C3N5Z7_9AGAM|nr:hypothetical protein OE88DRAFT_1678891 [Heliocybe sulcata]
MFGLLLLIHVGLAQLGAASTVYDTSSLQARSYNTTVSWGSCGSDYERFQCANISVPLDYNDASDTRTATIFVNRIQGTNTTHKLGSIFINPGGPGVSGSIFNFVLGQNLSAVLKGQYDIIGFDPRGVRQSKPYVSCFDSLLEEEMFVRNTSNFRLNLPSNITSDVAENLKYQLINVTSETAALSAQCFERLGNTVKLFGTEAVVHDIDILSKLIDGDDAPINYWGWSYGTVIGQYMLAILPPERLGRIIIDGIVDVVGWSDYPIQPVNVTTDMGHVLEGFATSCASSGNACAISNLTAPGILSMIDNTLDSLYRSPAFVTDLGADYGQVPINAGNLRYIIFEAMYDILSWPLLGEILSEAFSGNYTLIAQATATGLNSADASQPDDSGYATSMIYCNDAKPYDQSHPPLTIDQLTQNVIEAVTQNSPVLGEMLYQLGLCQFWGNIMPSKSRYNGTFDLAPGTLRDPILVLSQTFDPVAALASAVRTQERLGDNARLVQQVGGLGHCTISQVSFCTLPIVQSYMLYGELPDGDYTACQVDQLPFTPFNESAAANRTEGLDLESREAWIALSASLSTLEAL